MQNREILETVPLLRELEESTREYLARREESGSAAGGS